MQAWDQVKVKNEKLERVGQAGLVVGLDGLKVIVKMDVDAEEVTFKDGDLELLGR